MTLTTRNVLAPSAKEMLADAAPKCGNCKWMRQAYRPEPRTLIPGKGICMEPTMAAAQPTLFYITDLSLCSSWEAKE